MKRRANPGRSMIKLALSALVALAAATTPGCEKPAPKPAPAPPDVVVGHPVRKPVTEYLEYTGNIEAYETVELRARVQGYLEKVLFHPGSVVNEGDLLFQIEKRPYAAAVEQAKAELSAARAALAGAEASAKLADELASQRAGPEIDRVIKAADRDAAAAAVEQAQAALESAQINLDYCEVRSPLTGRITKNYVDVGNLVGSGEATLLAIAVDSTPVYVSVDASENDLLMVRRRNAALGTPVEPGHLPDGESRPVVLAPADRDSFDIRGEIDYVDPAINPDTGTIRVRSIFPNEDGFLLPGMFVRMRFLMGEPESIVIPEKALGQDQRGFYVFVVGADNRAEQRRVTLGPADGVAERVIAEGLSTDDRIIIEGLSKARPGMPVTPIAPSADANPQSPQGH